MQEPDFIPPRFDEPSPFGEEIEAEEGILSKIKGKIDEVSAKAKPFLEKHGVKILAAVIALIALFFVYDFFIGSIASVQLVFMDTEGKAIDSLAGEILSLEGEKIESFLGGEAKLNLRKGSYRVRFQPNEIYKTQTLSFDVVGETTEEFVLEKDFDVEVLSFAFPRIVSLGEEKQVVLGSVKSNDDKAVQLEFLFKDKSFLDLFDEFEVQPGTLTLQPGTQANVSVSFKVKKDLTVKNQREGDEINGKFLVRYLKDSNPVNKSFNFRLVTAPELAITPRDSLNLGNVEAGSLAQKEVKIQNKSQFDVSDVELSMEITYAPKNAPENALNWFSWNLCPDSSSCKVNIESGKTLTIFLTSALPLEAASESVRANLRIRKDSFEHVINVSMEVKATEIELASKLSRESFTVRKLKNSFEELQASLTLTNESSIPLEEVTARIEKCDELHARFTDPTRFPVKLEEKGKSAARQEFNLIISAPFTEQAGTLSTCNLIVSFRDPLTRIKKEQPPIAFSIEAKE